LRATCPEIVVRVDADQRVGLGHAVRSAALLDALRFRPALTVVGEGEVLASCFPTSRRVCGGDAALRQVLLERSPQLVLIDLPDCAAALRCARAVTQAPLAAIDDFGGDLPADLIINGTPTPAQHQYRSQGYRRGCVMTGAGYALLRPCFAAAASTPHGEGPAVALVVGSGSRAERWVYDLLESPAVRRWGSVELVVGKAFPKGDLEQTCVRADVALHRGLSGESLASLLASARVALVTGGMIVYECLAVRTPTVVFPHVAGTVGEARWLSERDALVDLGPEAGANPTVVGDVVSALLKAPGRARRLAETGHVYVDGLGAQRAARALACCVASRYGHIGEAVSDR